MDDAALVPVDFRGVDACDRGRAVEQNAHHPGFKPENRDAIVVGREIRHNAVDLGHHGHRAAKDPVEPVRGVDGVVEIHADVGDRVEVPFGRARGKAGIEQHRDAMSPANNRDLAHCAALHQGFDFAIDRILAHLKGHAELDARVVHRVDDSVAIFEGGGHGFLKQDVFARLCGHLRVVRMPVGLDADHDRVDVGIVEHCVC